MPLLLQVFITPMPLLRLMAACGMPHLRNLDEAVNIMREAMLDVIQVGFLFVGGMPCTVGLSGRSGGLGSQQYVGVACCDAQWTVQEPSQEALLLES